MKFLGHTDINAAFDRLLGNSRLYCAVAFWGYGAAEHLQLPQPGRDIRIICNLSMGGTNPAEIRKLRQGGAQIQQIDTLHAKVYIGDTEMLVTSANASTNGLGFEGAVQGNWIEAGVIGPIQDLALDWFKDLWSVSRPITEEDLALATVKWSQRQAYLSTSARSFADFDLAHRTLPLVDWYGASDWKENRKAIVEQLGEYNDAVEERIDNSFDIRGPEDAAALQPGTWVIKWRQTQRGVGKAPLEWGQVGDQRINKAYSSKGRRNELIDVMLPAKNPEPDPFDASEPKFHAAFATVMYRREFADLRSRDYDGCWNTRERLALLPAFWREVKAVYLSTTK